MTSSISLILDSSTRMKWQQQQQQQVVDACKKRLVPMDAKARPEAL